MSFTYIATFLPGLRRSALGELRAAGVEAECRMPLGDGVLLVRSALSEDEFRRRLTSAGTVFVRHIMPVHCRITLTQQRDADLSGLRDCALQAAHFAEGEHFMVQCRRAKGSGEYNAKDVEVCIGTALEEQGAVARFSDVGVLADESLKVVSVFLRGTTGYVGVSSVCDNLNEHCDEHRVCSRTPRHICRSENKLVEALRKFRIDLRGGRALDLGAAPGGWTRVLAGHGLTVTAVDPAVLHPALASEPSIEHVRAKSEEYTAQTVYDIVTNDMNVRPERSAQQMLRFSEVLQPGAPAIMTVKLIEGRPERLLTQTMEKLSPRYEVVQASNLFHNRLEVTLHLRRSRDPTVRHGEKPEEEA